jgi:centractin
METAIVIDAGSGVIKAGFAGDDKPRALYASILGRPKHKRVMAGGALEGDVCVTALGTVWRRSCGALDTLGRGGVAAVADRAVPSDPAADRCLPPATRVSSLPHPLVGQKAEAHRGALALTHPMSHGIVEDWDGMGRVLSHAYDGANLSVAPEDSPVRFDC